MDQSEHKTDVQNTTSQRLHNNLHCVQVLTANLSVQCSKAGMLFLDRRGTNDYEFKQTQVQHIAIKGSH